jgi:alkylation response protein AidB-like acyl-CoA dehydrogenase
MAAHNSLCTGHIYYHGTKEQKEKYLPKLATGEWLGRMGTDRTKYRFDAMRMKCTAKKVDGGWVLNGTKCWNHTWYLQ